MAMAATSSALALRLGMKTDTTFVIDNEDLYPIDEQHRFRIYAVIGHSLNVLATTDSAGGVGQAIVQIHVDQQSIGRRLADLGRIGVLDVIERDWVVLPWDRESAPRTVWP